MYIAPLDVTRRTKLDADWGLGKTAFRVDITPWCLWPYEDVCSRVLDIVRTNNSKAGGSWEPHRAFNSTDGIQRMGFLFEIKKRRDNTLIAVTGEVFRTWNSLQEFVWKLDKP